jgi:predicted ABC-class ATPase
MHRLREKLKKIDKLGYKAYKTIKGGYDFSFYQLFVDIVQGDPFASPSRVRIRLQNSFDRSLFSTKPREIGFLDYLVREFSEAIKKYSKGIRGSGNSGRIEIVKVGQEILERSAIKIIGKELEVRFRIGLPAYGRKIDSRVAMTMFFEELPKIVEKSLKPENINLSKLKEWVELVEDVEFIRKELTTRKLVSFLGDNSILPRRSGVDDRPLEGAIPFKSPISCKVKFITPNHGEIEGMGIPFGVTLIVGGGYHGKSTLLRAIERGVYPHIPGDGREWVVTLPSATKIRAEDGRYIEKVNISPFIGELPEGKLTTQFSTLNASGSTSQAANIIEAIELGAKLLLIDEDTSATNFMIRDRRMQLLVSKEKEPITPFVDRVQDLYEELGVNTIVVLGGSGDYLDVANTVILMNNYLPYEVTNQAKEIVKKLPTYRVKESKEKISLPSPRFPSSTSFNPRRGKREVKIQTKGKNVILFGTTPIDLHYVEQIVDEAQTKTIGEAIHWVNENCFSKGLGLKEGIDKFFEEVKNKGLDILSYPPYGGYALPRPIELGFAINRMRTLKMRSG